MHIAVKNIRKLFSLLFLMIFIEFSFAGNPLIKSEKTATSSIFQTGWTAALSPDLTFYGNQQIWGLGISFEPSVTDFLSLNYKFSLNYKKNNLYSIHGNPGTVVSPYMFMFALEADSNRGGWVVLSLLTLLLPEGVNFKVHPHNFSQFSFSIYINPFGIDYARRLETLPKTIYMSGETGIKTYFQIKDNFFAGAYGGIRSIYRFGKLGFTAGFQIGYVFPRD